MATEKTRRSSGSTRVRTPALTPQQCVDYAVAKSADLPEPLRMQVYWGTIIALAISAGRP